MYSSSSCNGVTRACTVNVATYGMSYVKYLQLQLRESYVYEFVVYSTERATCTAAVVAAVMELRMSCQRCYARYVLRTVSTAAASVVLPFYAATLWVVASSYTYSQSFYKQTKQQQYQSCLQLSRFFGDPHMPTRM